MKLVVCSKGHRYDPTLSKYCPECARNGLLNGYDEGPETENFSRLPETVPAPQVARCPRGHYYDSSLVPSCPVCARENPGEDFDMTVNRSRDDSGDYPETVPVPPMQTPEIQISKCSRGHFYDRSLGKCPICSAMDSAKPTTPSLDRLVTCSRGHLYNASIVPSCPECAATDERNRSVISQNDYDIPVGIPVQPEDDLPEFEDYPETVPIHDFPEEVTQHLSPEQPEDLPEEPEDYPATVPLNEDPPDAPILRCDRGHLYDRALGGCPICAAMAYQEPETVTPVDRLIEMCGKGHRYDKSIADYCPVCAAIEGRADPKVSAEPVEEPVVIPESEVAEPPADEKEPPVIPGPTVAEPPADDEEPTVTPGPEAAKPVTENTSIPVSEWNQTSVEEENPNRFNIPEPAEAPAYVTDYANVLNPDNTLIFTAYGSASFRLYMENGKLMLQLRQLLRNPVIILEKTICIPDGEAKAAAREILQLLSQPNNKAILDIKGHDPKGSCRLLFNTRQLSCDYRWKEAPGLQTSAEGSLMREIHTVLYRLVNKFNPTPMSLTQDKSNCLAELEHGPISVLLQYADSGYYMKVRSLIYYEWIHSVTLEKAVPLSREDAMELTEWLCRCGLMEALIQKSLRPGDEISRDPGFATGFYLHSGDLTYSYRDWNKTDSGEESALMNAAVDHLLDRFVREQEES